MSMEAFAVALFLAFCVLVVGVLIISLNYLKAMERIVTHALASEKTWDRSKEASPATSEVRETSDLEEFEQEQDEMERMELRHISKAARL